MSEEKLRNMLGQDRITSRQIDELVGLARIRATRTLPSYFAWNLERASVSWGLVRLYQLRNEMQSIGRCISYLPESLAC